jgi:hypothetical protein
MDLVREKENTGRLPVLSPVNVPGMPERTGRIHTVELHVWILF